MKNGKRFFKDKQSKYLATIGISALLLVILAWWYNTAEMRNKGVTDDNLLDQYSEAMEMLDAYSGTEEIDEIQPKDFGKALRLRKHYVNKEPFYYLENVSKFYISEVTVEIDEAGEKRTVTINEFIAPGAVTSDFKADVPRSQALKNSLFVKEGSFTDTFRLYEYEWINENKRILAYELVEEFDPMARYILPNMQLNMGDNGEPANMISYIDNMTDYTIHSYRFTYYDAAAEDVKRIEFHEPTSAQGISEQIESPMPEGATIANVRPRFALMLVEDQDGYHNLLYDFGYGKVVELGREQGE